MKRTLLTLGAGALLVSLLSGCAGTYYAYDGYPSAPVYGRDVIVVDQGTSVVVDIDYWYDGARYYYRDNSVGLYFYWSGGSRVWCDRGWIPNRGWHRHDGHYRSYDPYWRNHPVYRGPVLRNPPVQRPPVFRDPPHRQPDRGFPGRGGHDHGHDHDGRGGFDNGRDHGGRR